jgi:hypothetical protein
MRTAYIPTLSTIDLEGPLGATSHGVPCDAIFAYRGTLPDAPNVPLLFFKLELQNAAADALVFAQRLLAHGIAEALGEGFACTGGHIAYAGERITFVDLRCSAELAQARLGLYLPAPSTAAAVAGPQLTALRLPGPLDVWVPQMLARLQSAFEDARMTTLALRATRGQLRE